MVIFKKLVNFLDKLNYILSTNIKLNILYKYISNKTLNIIISNISKYSIDLILLNKDKINLLFIEYFGFLPSYILNSNQLIFNLVDISKVNYELFLQIMKLNVNVYSNCDNYFCSFIEYKNICLSTNKFTNADLYTEIFNRIRTIDFSTFSTNIILDKGCKLLYNNLPSLDWINSQIIYLNSLDTLSKNIINLYTKTGDKLINNYLRNFNNPKKVNIYDIFLKNIEDNRIVYNEIMGTDIYTENSIEIYIRKLIKRLKNIIDGSPLISKSFYVYRGRTDKLIGSDNYNLESFISTSLLTKIAIDFSNNKYKDEYGTIIRFKIKGRALLLSNSKYLKEYEILLPFNNNYTLKNQQISEFITPIKTKVNINYIEYS